jgi:hypothetical protein
LVQDESAGVRAGTADEADVWSEEIRISAVDSRRRFTRFTSRIMNITQARTNSATQKSAIFGQRNGGVGGGVGELMEL